MSRRQVPGRPKPDTLKKRRQRARHLREADPARFYLKRHRRRLARRQPKPRDMDAELVTLMAEQPASLEELMAAMGLGGE